MEEPDTKRQKRRYTVGYALSAKKQRSFIQQSLINRCSEREIDLVRIDTERPLLDQGPFDCVLHKIHGQDWHKQLKDFELKNQTSIIIDLPENIKRLHNRISMLQVVSGLKIETDNTSTFGIPNQHVVYDFSSLLDKKNWEFLKFPIVAKPLIADGSAKSHKMCLVFNHGGMNKLKPPIVLQEFVNHGGVIFKVYVVGDFVKCVKRKSLPDVSGEKMTDTDVEAFSQVSNLSTGFGKSIGGYYNMMDLDDTEMPPECFITKLARGLRRALKLNLFNFDVIRDVEVGNNYLVIDINYFPGYAKMPGYESILADFFLDVVKNVGKYKEITAEDPESDTQVKKSGSDTGSGVDDVAEE